jgi:serine/threonine protein kinase
MMIAAGTRLGPYEILAPIGAGGMGEVYRARDTRLDRTVAVKVLPQHLSASPEVRQRFEREARTISQLSHSWPDEDRRVYQRPQGDPRDPGLDASLGGPGPPLGLRWTLDRPQYKYIHACRLP